MMKYRLEDWLKLYKQHMLRGTTNLSNTKRIKNAKKLEDYVVYMGHTPKDRSIKNGS